MPGNNPNAAGNHRKSMIQAVEASVRRLQTDYYQDQFTASSFQSILPWQVCCFEAVQGDQIGIWLSFARRRLYKYPELEETSKS